MNMVEGGPKKSPLERARDAAREFLAGKEPTDENLAEAYDAASEDESLTEDDLTALHGEIFKKTEKAGKIKNIKNEIILVIQRANIDDIVAQYAAGLEQIKKKSFSGEESQNTAYKTKYEHVKDDVQKRFGKLIEQIKSVKGLPVNRERQVVGETGRQLLDRAGRAVEILGEILTLAPDDFSRRVELLRAQTTLDQMRQRFEGRVGREEPVDDWPEIEFGLRTNGPYTSEKLNMYLGRLSNIWQQKMMELEEYIQNLGRVEERSLDDSISARFNNPESGLKMYANNLPPVIDELIKIAGEDDKGKLKQLKNDLVTTLGS